MSVKPKIIKTYTSKTAASIVDFFYSELVSKEDQKLLELTFAKKIEQAQLEEFLKNWDIEKFGGKKSMLLSYVMKTNPDLKFPMYEKPRLEGLLKYHRFHNLKLITHYTKIVRELNRKNIFPMILKGGAMKHLRPDLSRTMGDIDILIPNESQLTKAREICKNLGYVEEIPDNHSIDLHLPNSSEGTVDIHRYIDFETNYNKSFMQDLFTRATKELTFGVQAFVPRFEDLLFLGMINLARNLNNKTSIDGILYSLFDFKYLSESKANFDWNLVLQNMAKTNTQGQALLAVKFINKIIPQMLPEALFVSAAANKKFIRHCDKIIFHRFYFNDFRQSCKNLSIKDALKSIENMKHYLTKKPQYFFVKRIIRKNHFLIRAFLILNNKFQTSAIHRNSSAS